MRTKKYLLLGLFSALIVLQTSCTQTEEKENIIGYVGLARKNPYLAAELYLKEAGYKVSSSTGSVKMDSQSTVIFSPASSFATIGEAKKISQWISNGGHYLCYLERGEDFWRDVGSKYQHNPAEWKEFTNTNKIGGLELLLNEVELGLIDCKSVYKVPTQVDDEIARGNKLPHTQDVLLVTNDGNKFEMKIGGNKLLIPKNNMYYESDWYAEGDTHHIFSRTLGDGRITFISDGRLFRNPYLSKANHIDFLDYLIDEDDEILFSLGKVQSFTSMLSTHAWPAMWALLILIIMWLWKSLPRFGPLLEIASVDFRNYAMHVQSTGYFLWRHKRGDVLLHSLRSAVLEKSGHGDVEGEVPSEIITKLCEISGLENNEVENAMHCTDVHNPGTMTKISKTLQKLLHSL